MGIVSLLTSLTLFITIASSVLFLQKRTLCSQDLALVSFEKATPTLLGLSQRSFKRETSKTRPLKQVFFVCSRPYRLIQKPEAIYVHTTKLTEFSQWSLPKKARTPKKQRVLHVYRD